MFFADNLLTDKKSPLGIAWLAATLGPKNANRRVSKKEVSRYDLVNACDYIAEPPEPLALRTSGILLFGVTRVYGQHYDEFQQIVTRFHHDVQRAIQSNFATTVNGRIAGNQGIDLVDEGKSKLDAITFAGIDFGWQSSMNLDLNFIDWSNPLNERSRRESSKLDSQLSGSNQSTQDYDEDDEEGSDDDDEEEGHRAKRAKRSSPYEHDLTRPRTSLKRKGDRPSPEELPKNDFFPEGIEIFAPEDILDGLGGGFDASGDPNSSWSAPDDFVHDMAMDQQGDDFRLFPDELPTVSTPIEEDGAKKNLKSPQKQKRVRVEEESSDEESVITIKKKKVKKIKTTKLDKSLEMGDDESAASKKRYKTQMREEIQLIQTKELEKRCAIRAEALVDAAGGWIEFWHPDLTELGTTIATVNQFKWEIDFAAKKLGNVGAAQIGEAVEDVGQGGRREGERQEGDDPFAVQDGGFQQTFDADPFTVTNEETTWLDVMHDTMEPLHDPSSGPTRRAESANPDVPSSIEAARRASQTSRVSFPWDDMNLHDDDDVNDAGFDNSFTPGRLHLSKMTPQEARLRLNSKSNSGRDRDRDLAGLVRRARSRSGSVLGQRAGGQGEMLFPGDDEDSLPQEIKDLADEPSQYLQLPAEFQPERLAMIDISCRDFMRWTEKQMVKRQTDEVEFEDVFPPDETSKRVAAAAFYFCLTLTTKKILKVEQLEPFDSFSIQFTARLKL